MIESVSGFSAINVRTRTLPDTFTLGSRTNLYRSPPFVESTSCEQI
jgi:hypothetical protein